MEGILTVLPSLLGTITIKEERECAQSMITLYQFEDCPYCAMVRAVLEDLEIPYKKADVSRDKSDPVRKMLLLKSGVGTVPVAEINGEFIGESAAIIECLKKLKVG